MSGTFPDVSALTYESSFPRWRCTCLSGGDPCCLRNTRKPRREQSDAKAATKSSEVRVQDVHGGAVSLGQRGCVRRRRGAMGTGGRCGQPRGRERDRWPADAERLDLGFGGGNDRQAEEAGGGAGPAQLVSPRPHVALRSGPVPTEADRSRPERRQGADAAGAGGVRLQGLPACGGMQSAGRTASAELGESLLKTAIVRSRARGHTHAGSPRALNNQFVCSVRKAQE